MGSLTASDTETTRLSRDDIEEARGRLAGRVWRTPVVRCDQLEARCGVRLWLKTENLQRGGSFKVRGALLAVDRLVSTGSRGVIAQSTGNHGISVALAAREHALATVVVLPRDAAPSKIRRIREAGAQVVTAGTLLADRLAAVDELRALHGYDVIDPYQDPAVVAGQGTATAELISQVAAEGVRLDAVVVPIGGGSAVAGACLAAQGMEVTVAGAEPETVPALTEALRAGRPVTVSAGRTIADGLRPDRIGALPFALAHAAVGAVLAMPEDAIAEAMRLAFLHARLVIEPAAATALAAALEHAPRLGRDVGVLLSGGNVEPGLMTSLLTGRLGAAR